MDKVKKCLNVIKYTFIVLKGIVGYLLIIIGLLLCLREFFQAFWFILIWLKIPSITSNTPKLDILIHAIVGIMGLIISFLGSILLNTVDDIYQKKVRGRERTSEPIMVIMEEDD